MSPAFNEDSDTQNKNKLQIDDEMPAIYWFY
jgi:hypothetical protein